MEQSSILNKLKEAATQKRLAEELSTQIRAASANGRNQEDIIDSMARSAEIQPGTINMILKGKIKSPPEKRLEGFAKALSSYQ